MYEFYVRCSKLKGAIGVSGIPNTFLVFYTKDGNEGWKEVEKSSVVKHSIEPAFGKPFKIEKSSYNTNNFKLRFAIYETSSSTDSQLKEKYFLGEIETTLETLLNSNPFTRRLMFENKYFARMGTITVFTEDLTHNEKIYKFKFAAKQLDDKDTLSVSDPYLEVQKRWKNDMWELLYRTEVIDDTLNPNWSEFSIYDRALINNNFTNEIRFAIFDYDADGKHDFIGESVVNIQELTKPVEISHSVEWQSINSHKKYRKGETYVNSGLLIMEQCKIINIKENSNENSFTHF